MKSCPKCQTEHNNKGAYCSRTCANSRGPRTMKFKMEVSNKLKGHNYQTQESLRKMMQKKGQIPGFDKHNTICKVCQKDTGTKHRKTCSDECYRLSAKLTSQLNQNCGGQKHTHRSKIINIRNEMFVAESSYEVKLASILNELMIYWTRPKFFWYNDVKNNKRRYYPDFYLPDYNFYIDPKNDYLIRTDIDKINRVSNQNDILILVLGEKYLNVDSIKDMVGDRGSAPLLPACKAGTLLLC